MAIYLVLYLNTSEIGDVIDNWELAGLIWGVDVQIIVQQRPIERGFFYQIGSRSKRIIIISCRDDNLLKRNKK